MEPSNRLAPPTPDALSYALRMIDVRLASALAAYAVMVALSLPGALVAAIIAGIVSALTRKLGASTRRRRSTTYSRTRTQRRTATTRSPRS